MALAMAIKGKTPRLTIGVYQEYRLLVCPRNKDLVLCEERLVATPK